MIEMEYKWIYKESVKDSEFIRRMTKSEKVYKMHSVYYDTADMYLHSIKSGLRIRCENESYVCCLKTDSGKSANGLAIRKEYECLASDIYKGLYELSKINEIEDICNTLISSNVIELGFITFDRLELRLEYNSCIFALCIDIGEINSRGKVEPLSEIELELVDGDELNLKIIAEIIKKEFNLLPQSKSKLERLLKV